MIRMPCMYCEHVRRCKVFQLACDAFIDWTEGRDFKKTPRKPTPEKYRGLYGS